MMLRTLLALAFLSSAVTAANDRILLFMVDGTRVDAPVYDGAKLAAGSEIAGPAVVKRALGVDLTKDELGGPQIHLKSGLVDQVADDEADAFARMRRFLGYLPSNVWEHAERINCDDPVDRMEESLLKVVPRNRRRAYKIRRLLELVVDAGSFFELTPLFGRSQVTGLARLGGHPVGVLANDPFHDGGAMTADGAQKVRRFVELCDAFHLPVVSFVDEPGFMIGPDAERAATIRHGMSAMFAVSAEAALLTLGGALKRKESLSGRLGDVLSQLYIASAALKRFADQDRQPADRPLLEWAVRDALYEAQQKLFEVYANLPNRLLGRMLKWMLFPYGASYRAPDDALLQRAANVILRWGSARERLTEGLFIPEDEHESMAQLETAFEKVAAAQAILSHLRKAMRNGQLASGDPEHCLVEAVSAGVIDEREAAQVRAAVAARQKVIGVDEFSADYWKEKNGSWQSNPTPSQQAGQSS